MAPYTNIPLSPAELSYLHNSLAQDPPVRPDGRSTTQFRPLVAETDILPSTNGSARICFADGTEAIVGIKAEVEKSRPSRGGNGAVVLAEDASQPTDSRSALHRDVDMDDANADDEGGAARNQHGGRGDNDWLEMSIEIPGLRDDDALPVFLAAMLTEALLADGAVRDRLWINSRFHWRLYIDILLLSQPLSYPLPLLSLTTHLALLSTRLPALISEKDEDPLFNDDWEAAAWLYPRKSSSSNTTSITTTPTSKPPITLLVMTVGPNTILFDPSKEELAVADAVVAISITPSSSSPSAGGTTAPFKVIALRTIDPPSRLTAAGVLNTTAAVPSTSAAPASGAAAAVIPPDRAAALRELDAGRTVWRPSRGGLSRAVLARMIKAVVEKGGVGEEVLGGLEGVEV